jgi:hypothetical protein
MKLSHAISFSLSFLFAWTLPDLARGDMGTVWVEAVTSDSITIDWQEPSGSHRPDQGAHEAVVSWQLVNLYPEDRDEGQALPDDRYPRSTGGNSRFIHLEKDKPFTISGLRSSASYRVKVEVLAEKRLLDGAWVNPIYRQVAMIKQRTLTATPSHNLRAVKAGKDFITLRFTNADWKSYPAIRLGYKRKWSSVLINPSAADASMQASGDPKEYGCKDSLTAPEIEVTLTGLSPDQQYEVVVYGFKTGATVGDRLGSVTAETSGYRLLTSVEACLAADHKYALDAYGREIREQCRQRVIDSVIDSGVVAAEEVEAIFADEKESLDNDLAVLLFLISGRYESFVAWQEHLSTSPCPILLLDFAQRVFPDAIRISRQEKETPPIRFQRGDLNADGKVDIADGIETLNHLFRGRRIFCEDAADSNDDGSLDVSDPVYLLMALFTGGKEPPAPFGSCGEDPTGDDLGCDESNSCPAD